MLIGCVPEALNDSVCCLCQSHRLLSSLAGIISRMGAAGEELKFPKLVKEGGRDPAGPPAVLSLGYSTKIDMSHRGA